MNKTFQKSDTMQFKEFDMGFLGVRNVKVREVLLMNRKQK